VTGFAFTGYRLRFHSGQAMRSVRTDNKFSQDRLRFHSGQAIYLVRTGNAFRGKDTLSFRTGFAVIKDRLCVQSRQATLSFRMGYLHLLTRRARYEVTG
jgi:hypothetical protein